MAQHQFGFLFLAAGASTRMLGRDKLLKEIDGVPLLKRTLDEALKLNFPVFATVPANDTKRKLYYIVSVTSNYAYIVFPLFVNPGALARPPPGLSEPIQKTSPSR